MASNVVHTEDLVPVRSRVSWGAIFAGAMVALAVYFLLSVLGAAVGLSVTGHVNDQTLGTGAAVWAIVAMLVALFLGGWVTSQCAVGENKMEAGIYGVILWGLMFAMILWLAVSGVRMGFAAVIGAANTPIARDAMARISDQDLQAAGLTPEQIQTFRARSQDVAGELRAAAQDPRATQAAWWTFGGILLSMIASVGGALAGAGPSVVLSGFSFRSTTTRIEPVR
jgi:hypothetical protein